MSGLTEANAAKQRRRKAVVDGMVDQIIADEDAIAEVHTQRKRRKAGDLARLKDAETAYKTAAQDANAAVALIVDSVDALASAVGAWDESASRLVETPGALVFLARIPRTRRLGTYVSRRFFDLFGQDRLGPIRLNAQGCRVPSKFADGEAQLMERVRTQAYHPLSPEDILTGAKPNGHDANDPVERKA